MKISFNQAEQWFGEAMWYWAHKLKNRYWAPEDLYAEILVKVVEAEWTQAYTYSIACQKSIPVDPSHVLTFVRSRMIDIVRREKRAPRGELPASVMDKSQPEVDARALLLSLIPDIDPKDLVILVEIATPSASTLALAVREQEEAREAVRLTGALRMNVNGAPKVTQSHVAKTLGVSDSRVALAVRRAGRALAV